MSIELEFFAKEAGRFRQDDALAREFFQFLSALERGIKLKNGIRPEPTLIEFSSNEVREPVIEDVDEALYIALVLTDDLITECEYIKWHCCYPLTTQRPKP